MKIMESLILVKLNFKILLSENVETIYIISNCICHFISDVHSARMFCEMKLITVLICFTVIWHYIGAGRCNGG